MEVDWCIETQWLCGGDASTRGAKRTTAKIFLHGTTHAHWMLALWCLSYLERFWPKLHRFALYLQRTVRDHDMCVKANYFSTEKMGLGTEHRRNYAFLENVKIFREDNILLNATNNILLQWVKTIEQYRAVRCVSRHNKRISMP